MKNDPFTITVALSSTSADETKAFGELYMDDGETYAHTRGELIWRGFTMTRTTGKTRSLLTLKSRDLVAPSLAKGEPIVETTNSFAAPSTLRAGEYDAEGNLFAKSIADTVCVERIVILGLERRPSSVRVGDRELDYSYFDGISAEGGRKKSGQGIASKLVIKKPEVSIVKDWDVVISL